MCFDEKTSWITLIIGSLMNIVAFIYLWYTQTKYTNMSIKKHFITPALLILLWQFCLLMQIPDGLAWNKIQSNKPIPDGIKKLAFFLNVLQPFIVFIVILFISNIIKQKLPITFWIGVIFLLIYGIIFVISSIQNDIDFDIKPEKSCKHIIYRWFDRNSNEWKNLRTILYFISILLMFTGLPKLWCISMISLFLISFLISRFLYSCAISSTWCWSIASTGLILLIISIVKNSKIKK